MLRRQSSGYDAFQHSAYKPVSRKMHKKRLNLILFFLNGKYAKKKLLIFLNQNEK